ncbi:MAG TPA: hypothetical protein VGX24_04165 [Pyrinomonadaceae bacterium]|jgi:hypothetical protein|nr:hypothetical protein [Pyrinomonadaceae bacterium]
MIRSITLCLLMSHSGTVPGCDSSTGNALPLQPSQKAHARSPIARKKIGGWQAATYRGLIMGESTEADMRRVLGEPLQSVVNDSNTANPIEVHFYKASGDILGDLIVAIDKNTDKIFSIELRPENLSKEEAVKFFGNKYNLTRYDADECLDDGESVPLYESSVGASILLEYRDRGLAIAFNERNKIDYIMYVSEPVGAPVSRCKKRD